MTSSFEIAATIVAVLLRFTLRSLLVSIHLPHIFWRGFRSETLPFAHQLADAVNAMQNSSMKWQRLRS
jgi:hypothetical protein